MIDLNSEDTLETSGEDIVESALDMAQGLGKKLDIILEKLEMFETLAPQIKEINSKLEQMNERFEEEVNKLNGKLKSVEERTCEGSVEFLGRNVEDMKKQGEESRRMTDEINQLERKLLNLLKTAVKT